MHTPTLGGQWPSTSTRAAQSIHHRVCGCVSNCCEQLGWESLSGNQVYKTLFSFTGTEHCLQKHSETGISISGYFYYSKSSSSPFFSNPTVSFKDLLKRNVMGLCYGISLNIRMKFYNRKTIQFFTLTSTKKKHLNFFKQLAFLRTQMIHT